MKFTIGIGVLIEGDAFNSLRNTELRLRLKNGNADGLQQPPHVTVKRPFVVNEEIFEHARSILHMTAQKFAPSQVKLTGESAFGTSVVFASVEPSEFLTRLHESLLKSLDTHGVQPDTFEGQNMVFHSTLAMNLTPDQFEKSQDILQNLRLTWPLICNVSKLGLFLAIDDDRHWIVIDEATLTGK
jgi:2'-5' RNA ligase